MRTRNSASCCRPWRLRRRPWPPSRPSSTAATPTRSTRPPARHCTQGANGRQISFHVGDLDQTKGTTVDATAVHEAPDSDIALVWIDQQIPTDYAPLGSEGDVKVGDQAEVYGWGATCTDKPEIECQPQLLQVAKASVTSIDCPDGVSVCANRGDGITAGGGLGRPDVRRRQAGRRRLHE
jgi:hypothetical protein